MRILLFGRNGQVGSALSTSSAGRDLVALGRSDVDLMQPGTAAAAIREIRPDVVVNAAAWTAVDLAESEPDAARRINVDAVAEMAGAMQTGWFVTYSTDYVFDGGKASSYTEIDTPAPLNVYGRTKLLGEAATAAVGGRHLVFRTSWVHTPGHANFLTTILRLATERESLSVVDDQLGAPTSATLIAQVTWRALDRIAQGRPLETGIYHLAASGSASWFDYARLILNCAHEYGAPLRCRADQVARKRTEYTDGKARRPLNSQLSTAKLEATLGVSLPDWQLGVIDTVRDSVEEARCVAAS